MLIDFGLTYSIDDYFLDNHQFNFNANCVNSYLYGVYTSPTHEYYHNYYYTSAFIALLQHIKVHKTFITKYTPFKNHVFKSVLSSFIKSSKYSESTLYKFAKSMFDDLIEMDSTTNNTSVFLNSLYNFYNYPHLIGQNSFSLKNFENKIITNNILPINYDLLRDKLFFVSSANDRYQICILFFNLITNNIIKENITDPVSKHMFLSFCELISRSIHQDIYKLISYKDLLYYLDLIINNKMLPPVVPLFRINKILPPPPQQLPLKPLQKITNKFNFFNLKKKKSDEYFKQKYEKYKSKYINLKKIS